jgi:hypothetical protein
MKTFKLPAVLLLLGLTLVGRATDPLDTWAWRNPVPPPTIRSFAFGGGQFVGVGLYGTIVTSSDGVNWIGRYSGTHKHLTAIAFGNGLFVALASGDVQVGVGGEILTSADGVNWNRNSQVLPGLDCYPCSAIAYGDGRFVAVGNGTILSSHDGTNWARQETGDSLGQIAYGNGKFVLLGSRSDGSNIVKLFDGVSWVELPPGAEQPVDDGLVYGNGQFLGVNGNVITSADGATWVDRGTQPPFPGDTAYANGLFFASDANNGGHTLATSTDGMNWTNHTSSGSVFVSGMAYGNGRFVAMGSECVSAGASQNCQIVFMSSADGVNWVASQPGFWFNDIAYGGGQFVAVGDGGIMTSTDDGVTWVRPDAAVTNTASSWIAYGNGQFAALGQSPGGGFGGRILTSADGVNWVERWSGSIHDPQGITYGNGLFAALADSGTILTSTDGVNWNQNQAPYSLLSIAYGNGKFVGVGDGIMTSTDAVNWRQTVLSTSELFPCEGCWNPLMLIAYGNGRFVALGSFASGNQIYSFSLVSPDGVSWVKQQWLTQYPPVAIAYGNGQFVAVGTGWLLAEAHGTIQTSRDGLTWSSLQVVAPFVFQGVAFGNGRFVAVGGWGEILQSGSIINLSVTPNTNPGLLSLSVEGPTGLGYMIQTTSDLLTWHDVARITNAPSDVVVTNGLPGTADRQFYRAVAQ